MRISGFTFVRNAAKLYYPIAQSIASILPIVDEFVVALGDSDADDSTRAEIEALKSDKVRIIDTVWDLKKYPRGMEHAHQTDIAMKACSGDWLCYLQADEVIHERDLDSITKRCESLLDDERVEGLLFKYRHFWGDYQHFHQSHGWYPHEIRIVRNLPDVHSWESAQSFRVIPGFDGVNYREKTGTRKLRVAAVDAWIYHYGWVRPPQLMKNKIKYFTRNHHGVQRADAVYEQLPRNFDYGPLNRLAEYNDSHPAVMQNWIMKFDWQDALQYAGKPDPNRERHKHERPRYQLLTFLEQKIFGGREIGGFKNYELLRDV